MSWATRGLRGALLCAAWLMLISSCSEEAEDPTDPVTTGSVRVTVTADGAARSGVTVRLFGSGGTSALASATTGADGRATINAVEAGAYEVEVVVPGGFELVSGETARKSVTVVAEQTATVSFGLQEIEVLPTEGDIRVLVEDGTSGVAGVEVKLFDAGGTTALATLLTAADGRVVFQSLDPGNYDVEITVPEDYEPAAGEATRKPASVTAGATTDVQFELASTLDVVIVTAAGTDFTPANVTISAGTTIRWVSNSGSHTVTPDGHTEWAAANLPEGATFEHTFDTAGEFDYFCEPHQSLGMTGSVTVQ